MKGTMERQAYSYRPYSYRSDPAVPPFPDDRPIVVFDGHCVICSAFARLIMRRDRERRFRLLAAQTPIGAALYAHFGLVASDYESNILLEDGRAWLKSEGSIRIFEQLGFPWSLISVARLLPRPLRDRLYQIIARNRLRWFGARDTCYRPDPAQADRFLEW
ncbi:Predicted thiol-disulfide oxidoreductase YuxK, DCC family [Rhizobiales bacterium GAS188]|nr:Predicted thiol-disulfide oxidoreductase YuxK, DCC family [Rhizobiales bacterium GAS188]